MRGVVLACVVVALAGCGKVATGGGKPSGDSWTHKELLAHLEAQGLKHEVIKRSTGSLLEGPAVHITFDGLAGPGMVITIEKDEQTARDKAGVDGKNGLAWNRFVFVGTAEQIALVNDALDGKSINERLGAMKRALADRKAREQRERETSLELSALAASYLDYADAHDPNRGKPFVPGEGVLEPTKGPPSADAWLRWAKGKGQERPGAGHPRDFDPLVKTKGDVELIPHCGPKGKYHFFWGADVRQPGYRNLMLGCVASAGGDTIRVVMLDGSSKTLTKEEFAKTPTPNK